ncbi:galactarate dehydratase [Erwinia sp. ErVv1]|uniref:galactarate dehydratase n=1 Tax=Erwinia sp. ErVv1 TaxID=1603299 RepID=UPI000829B051|nr:galactarate dehydratase [Erwinia sp. ErVv1]
MNIINKEAPLYIKVHEKDNVAIVVNNNGLTAGSVFPCGLVLKEHIPQGHKVALNNIAKGADILRYGEVIGYALRDIAQGCWIDESLVGLPTAPNLASLPLATAIPPALPALEGYTFEGYRNSDGSVGTRNLLAITTSVHCVAGVVDYVVSIIERQLLPDFPNVDGVVALNHLYGCGVAINAPAAIIPIRTLHNLALNPNFGGEVMVVGLGCEKLQPERLLQGTPDVQPISLDEDDIVRLQDEQHVGFESMVNDILRVAKRHLQRLNQRRRETVPASELVVGMQCGGSDAFSGVTANPAVGFASDLLVRCGATVMFSEVTEVRDAVHLLTPRVIDEQTGQRLLEEMAWYDDYLNSGQTDRSANPSPGNKKGGLANVVEKALGSIAKSGSSAIVEVLSPGQRPTRRGLIYAATPASDFICGTQQMASGITLQVFTTGRGTPYGLAAIPVIKMATRSALAERWYDLMDINAGTIATGEESIEQVGWRLFELIIEIASGRKQSWSDRWGIHNALAVFNPAPVT